MTAKVGAVEVFTVTIPRDTPYLGELGSRDHSVGDYFVRAGNGTVYPTVDRSVIVRISLDDGREGWGETYGLVAPGAVHALIVDIVAPFVLGRSPLDVRVIWDGLYDLMRVRGYQGGFWLDAVAAVDIALWDLAGQISGLPLHNLLGGTHRRSIPAYVSGLPAPTQSERVEMAREFAGKGFRAFKIAAVTTPDSVVEELKALRDALGPDALLMVDMHWMYTPANAIALLRRVEEVNLSFAEAPVAPEDIEGLAAVLRSASVPIAGGEEWRTVFDARPRLEKRAVSIIQPEMGHTGVTQFLRMADLAASFHVPTIPHATIGVGIFLAASLHASATIRALPWHEYQHSIFDRNVDLIDGRLTCADGYYGLPEGPGLGVRPSSELRRRMEPA